VRECRYVCGGRKGRGFFFPAKKLRNAPWEVVSPDSRIFIAKALIQQTKMKGNVADVLISRCHRSQCTTD
jgi:hypothetical protein